jgi:hypothetical protein
MPITALAASRVTIEVVSFFMGGMVPQKDLWENYYGPIKLNHFLKRILILWFWKSKKVLRGSGIIFGN